MEQVEREFPDMFNESLALLADEQREREQALHKHEGKAWQEQNQ